MSVTIRYNGVLKDMKAIEELQEEFLDIASTQEWPSEIVDGAYSSLKRDESLRNTAKARGLVTTASRPLTLKGIKLVVHPQTDPLWFTFDSEGALTRLSYFAVDYYPGTKAEAAAARASSRRYEFVHQSQASIQTTLGGPELHRTVVRVLDYLKKKYVPDLKVLDDSTYWQHRDLDLLKQVMNKKA
jgi:hypothetical protein